MAGLKHKLAEWLLKDTMPGGMLMTGGVQTGAGVAISEDRSMQYAAVQACVRVLSEDIAALPLHLYRRTKDGGKERATDHPMYRLLHNQPNPEMTSVAFREALMVNLLLTGNGYAFIEYDGLGRVMALWPLLSSMVEPFRAKDGIIRYRVNGYTIEAEEILHIPGLGYDGLVGMSPIAYARESIGLGVAAEQFGSAFFKNGTHLGGVITMPGKMDDAAYERTSREFKAMYKGLQNSHGIPLLEGGAKFEPVGIAPDDAQFLETRKYQRTEIAAIFRVPLHLIGDLEHATFSNIEHQDLSYLQRSLLPWLVRIEQGMNNRLLTDEERANYMIEHDTAGFMRGDTKSRYEAYSIAIQNGIMTRNEARIRENMNPVEGADELLQPLNMKTVGASGQTGGNGKTGTQGAPEDEPNGRRSFALTDISTFTSDRRRRAVLGTRSAAKALGLKESQLRALEKAFSKWLTRQAADITKIAEDVFGKRAKTQWDEFNLAVEKYFDALKKEGIPKDIKRAVESVTNTAIERIRADVGSEADGIDEKWIQRYLEIYYADERDRLLDANEKAIKKYAKEQDSDQIGRLIKKLSDWGDNRAQRMAEIESAMALNEALVAGYKEAGYMTEWRSGAGCCKICISLNGRSVTTLKPPLHKGCTCSVAKGEKYLTKPNQDGKMKYKHNEDGTIFVTDDWTDTADRHVPIKYKAGSVVQIAKQDGTIYRIYYGLTPDENGEADMVLQIHPRGHGSKAPDYKHGGMHAHDFVDGKG